MLAIRIAFQHAPAFGSHAVHLSGPSPDVVIASTGVEIPVPIFANDHGGTKQDKPDEQEAANDAIHGNARM
jgi:hypothetical protein